MSGRNNNLSKAENMNRGKYEKEVDPDSLQQGERSCRKSMNNFCIHFFHEIAVKSLAKVKKTSL